MRDFYLRHKEILRYVFFGFCSTFVNWGVHFLIVALFPAVREDPSLNTLATVIAWTCAVIFSFFVNKKWVFEEQSWDLRSVGGQFLKFVGARLLTLGTDADQGSVLLPKHHRQERQKLLPLTCNGKFRSTRFPIT